MKYRRTDRAQPWHWCTGCSNWPSMGEYQELDVPPDHRPSSGKLDEECLAKERAGTCAKVA